MTSETDNYMESIMTTTSRPELTTVFAKFAELCPSAITLLAPSWR